MLKVGLDNSNIFGLWILVVLGQVGTLCEVVSCDSKWSLDFYKTIITATASCTTASKWSSMSLPMRINTRVKPTLQAFQWLT